MQGRQARAGSLLLLAGCVACAGGQSGPEAPLLKETAADEIQRISSTWSSTEIEKGLLSPPSPISLSTTKRSSVVRLTPDAATEALTIEESLDLRAGGRVRCRTSFDHPLTIRFGRKQGEAAIELERPALSAPRRCDGPHPEPLLSEPARRGLFVLRGDQLIAVDPPRDDRRYRPDSL